MLSTEFDLYFKRYKELYLGCFSSDNYPRNFNANYQFFIVNRDSSDKVGSHWMAAILINNTVEFFDSVGTDEQTVKQFLKFNKPYDCLFNETVLQPSHSSSCGQFCVFFIIKRLLEIDISFSKLLNIYFSSDTSKNNKKVDSFCINYLGH